MKGYEAVKELLESELSDYGFFECGEIEIDEGYDNTKEDEYYTVDIQKGDDTGTTLRFHYNKESDKLEIDMNEDNWEEVRHYDWQVKYFWMALLKW